jgi:hypothetical protein
VRIIAVSFIFFVRQLTVVGIVNASAAERQHRASLHTAQHTQRVLAHCMPHVMRIARAHVAAWHSPWEVHSFTQWLR